MPLRPSSTANPIQCFCPDPSKTTTLTLTAGTATWTPGAGVKNFMFYPSTAVVMKLNTSAANGTTGLSFPATTLSPWLGIHGATASITFTGTAGQTVVIESD